MLGIPGNFWCLFSADIADFSISRSFEFLSIHISIHKKKKKTEPVWKDKLLLSTSSVTFSCSDCPPLDSLQPAHFRGPGPVVWTLTPELERERLMLASPGDGKPNTSVVGYNFQATHSWTLPNLPLLLIRWPNKLQSGEPVQSLCCFVWMIN